MSTTPAIPADDFESKLSPEQRVQLEHDRSQTAQSNAAAEQSRAATAATQAEMRQMNEKIAFGLAVEESGVKFHSKNIGEVQTLVATEYEITTGSNGKVIALDKQTGKSVPLKEAIEQAAVKHPTWVDGRSLKRLRGETEEDGSKTIKSKSEFTTTQQRIDYVHKHGLDRWEKLPLRPPSQVGMPTTQEEFRALSTQRKSALINEKGIAWLENLPKEATEAERNRRAGIRVNKTGK